MPRIKVEDRRAQLVEAAVAVMSREGLERATTRRIAEEAGAPQGAFHYAFRDKNELLMAVIGEVVTGIERILRAAVDPAKGLAAAIDDGLRGFWAHVVSDDGLQLMQYELMIFARRTEGFEWLAEWQYARYVAAAREVFGAAAEAEGLTPDVDLDALSRFLVAAVDGLVIQYEVHHDAACSERDLAHVIRAATLLAGPEAARA